MIFNNNKYVLNIGLYFYNNFDIRIELELE